MGPSTPLCQSSKCQFLCAAVWLAFFLGYFVRSYSLGIYLFVILALQASARVRLWVFPPHFFFLFVCCLLTSLSFSISLSLSLFFSAAGEMQTMFGLHFPLRFVLLAAVFSLHPYFVLITFIKVPLPPVFRFVFFFFFFLFVVDDVVVVACWLQVVFLSLSLFLGGVPFFPFLSPLFACIVH